MKLHVFPASPNARKAMVVNTHLGLNIPEVLVDLPKGAHKSEAYLALNPNGKVPVLELDDGTTLWESNAIIDKMAGLKDSDMWPRSDVRYDIMRWQFWESCHWTPTLSKYIGKYLFGNDGIDMVAAEVDALKYAAVLDAHLAGRKWLVGEAMTTADISVGAILCYREPCHYPLGGFANVASWIARLEGLAAWKKVNMAPAAA